LRLTSELGQGTKTGINYRNVILIIIIIIIFIIISSIITILANEGKQGNCFQFNPNYFHRYLCNPRKSEYNRHILSGLQFIPGVFTLSTGPPCGNAQYQTRSDTSVVGASPPPLTFPTVQQCIDYCTATSSCVGVDVDYNKNPVNCWVHTNANDYVPNNIYTQPGTNSYQLITRCASSTTGSGYSVNTIVQ